MEQVQLLAALVVAEADEGQHKTVLAQGQLVGKHCEESTSGAFEPSPKMSPPRGDALVSLGAPVERSRI